jgi:hypothetical protein
MGAGIAWWWTLVSSIGGEVFYSGDGGLKALMVRQLLDGRAVPWLALDAPPWLEALWAEGTYPFHTPFVHELDGRTYPSFEWPFAVVSAPGYALFGHAGLHVVPALAVLATWARFARLLGALRVGLLAKGLSLAVLVFATPLTFYGATFWEHSLAVALAFAGYADLASSELDRRTPRAVRAGVLLGLAVFFRPEAGAFAAAALLAHASLPGWRASLASGGAFALVVSLYLAMNRALYGTWLGAHGIEALGDDSNALARVSNALELADALHELWMRYLPVTWVALLLGGVALGVRGAHGCVVRRAFLTLALAFAATALVAPNAGGMQIGPRYLLALVPVLVVVIALGLDRLSTAPRAARLVAVLALVAVAGLGAHENLVARSQRLRESYATRILPSWRAVASHQQAGVLFAHPWAALELAQVFEGRPVATVDSRSKLDRAVQQMIAHGHDVLLLDGPDERAFRVEPRSRHRGVDVEWTVLSTQGQYTVLLGRPRTALAVSPTSN